MARNDDTAMVAGIRLTHPERVLFAEQDVTKRDLAAYLEAMAEHMLPHVAGRLISLVRCPQGQEKACFFQRHASAGFPEELHRFAVREKEGGEGEYLYVEDVGGLVAAAQMGVLELHIWGSRIDDIERPDRLVFDLDPDTAVDFDEVKDAAVLIRDLLEEHGLESFALVTGGKGIHVVAPLVRRHEWPVVKAFAEAVAQQIARNDPERFVATAAKEKRKGRIFIDYLRNERSASAIAPYSPRAREGGPLAWPVGWKELRSIRAANQFCLAAAHRPSRDAWASYGDVRQSIKNGSLRALGIAAGG